MFTPLLASRAVQAASMVLRPGESSGDTIADEHRRCEQWLYVVSGTGRADFLKRRVRLQRGTLLLIERNEPHRITNTGTRRMVTMNFYAPPAYTNNGDVRPNAR